MWEPVEEKTAMYARAGDFYYGKLREEDQRIARTLAHVHAQCRVLRQACNIQEALLSGGYFEDNFKMITFTDADVDWHGVKIALQKQYVKLSRKKHIVVEDSALVELETLEEKPAAQANNLTALAAGKDIVFPDDTQLVFSLKVDKDIMVTSIRLDDGRMLYANQDFLTEFGRITFYENPLDMFPRHKFLANSYTYRAKNLYCFPLSVDVYGPIDRILHYYKISNSPHALYLASAQAAGLAVIRQKCTIKEVAPLLDGATYFTTDGRYDAPYPHTTLTAGTTLQEEYIIGGNELYRLISPYEPLPSSIASIYLDYALPVPGLIARDLTIQITDAAGKFRPEFSGDTEALRAYWDYIAEWEGRLPDTTKLPKTANAIKFFREQLCARRCIIAQINRDQMLRDMQLRLLAFLRRELPLGSVLATADLIATIKETKLSDV